MFIIEKRKIFFAIAALLITASVAVIAIRGFAWGIDFQGGALLEISYRPADIPTQTEEVEESADASNRSATSTPLTPPTMEELHDLIATLNIGEPIVQPTGENGYLIRTLSVTEEQRRALMDSLNRDAHRRGLELKEERFDTIGPTIGAELRSKAWIAIAAVIVSIILFIAYVFREVSEPVSSWYYGYIAIVALMHDILIPSGIVSLLGIEVDSLFVIALLAILGLSVNDTIVVFDRVRENLRNHISHDFAETVGKSLEQTFTRSINTSLTTLFVLGALYFVGPDSTRDFAFVLAVGMIAGTYSSIFLASPLLVEVERRISRRNENASHR